MEPTTIENFRQALWITVRSMAGLFVFMGMFILLIPALFKLFPKKKDE